MAIRRLDGSPKHGERRKVEEGWMEGRVLMPALGCQDLAVIVAISDVDGEASTSLIEEVCRWVAARSIGGVER
jgi:hypothetical protein